MDNLASSSIPAPPIGSSPPASSSNLYPPPAGTPLGVRGDLRSGSAGSASFNKKGWEYVVAKDSTSLPCQRSLHAGAVWKDCFVVFGGYDGHRRVNDLYSFNFKTSQWQELSNANAPSPRDRHVATVYENFLYIFGGFDGMARVNDLHAYRLDTNVWHAVDGAGQAPSPRHSHAAVVYRESMFVFGGYDGSYRSDLHEFHFNSRRWKQVHHSGEAPRARYRGTCVVTGDAMLMHGGHDGNRHLQDTHVFDFLTSTWSSLLTEEPIPSPRDSHVSVIYGKSMFLYGGSTGSAMGDFHELKLEFRRSWSPVVYGNSGSGSSNVGGGNTRNNSMGLLLTSQQQQLPLHTNVAGTPTRLSSRNVGGGGLGQGNHYSNHDVNVNMSGGMMNNNSMSGGHNALLTSTGMSSPLVTPSGSLSPTAGSVTSSAAAASSSSNGAQLAHHSHGINANSLGSHSGGGGGAAMWGTGNVTTSAAATAAASSSSALPVPMQVATGQQQSLFEGEEGEEEEDVILTPGVRFCHVGVVYENSFYIFGGYDGVQRLNDFLKFNFEQNASDLIAPASTLIPDLRTYVNNEAVSDVQFIVEGIPVYAHKILCLRCPYFRNMLTGEYMESRAREIVIHDVKYATFLQLMYYLYTDEADINIDSAMELFQLADRFGIDRLKRLCELEMLHAITVESAANILYTADQYNAENLREQCILYILMHFDAVSRTLGFEEMGRTNVELVFEILRRR